MSGWRFVVLLSTAVGALLGLGHEYRWFEPPEPEITFWASEAFGGIIWGAAFGATISGLAIWAAVRLARGLTWGGIRVRLLGVGISLAMLGLAAVAWDFVEGAQGRRIEGTITSFRTGFDGMVDVRAVKGNAPIGLKQLIVDWYALAGRIASGENADDAMNAASRLARPEYTTVLAGMLRGDRPWEWERLTWGDPGKPCRGPFSGSAIFRAISIDYVDDFARFQPWDPARGGLFERVLRLPPRDSASVTLKVSRQVGQRWVAADGSTNVGYACWRSEADPAAEVFTLCRDGDAWRICGQTDTSGLWIVYPFEAMGDTRPMQVSQTQLAGSVPEALATDGMGVWVADSQGARLIEFNRDGTQGRTVLAGISVAGLSVGADGVWVADSQSEQVMLLPREGKEPRLFDLPGVAIDIAPAADGVWVASQARGKYQVTRLTRDDVEESIEVPGLIAGLASDSKTAWVFGAVGLRQIKGKGALGDPVVQRSVSGPMVWDGFAFWTRGFSPGILFRIDAENGQIDTINVGGNLIGLAASESGVWVGDGETRAVVRIGLNGEILGRWPVHLVPERLLYDGEALWIADPATGKTLVRLPIPK